MKEVYPEFADQVRFYAVGTDPTESLDGLERYREEQGYPWPIALPDPNMLSSFRVLTQSTKIAIDDRGAIVYRDGYGRGDPDTWREVFARLAESAGR